MKKYAKKTALIMLFSLLAISLAAGLAFAADKLIVQDGASNDVFTVDDTGTVKAGGYVGIGDITTPLALIQGKGSTSESSQFMLMREETNSNAGAGFIAYHNNANYGMPVTGERLGYFLFGSYYQDVAGQYGPGIPGFLWPKNGGGIAARAGGDWSYTSAPTYFTFETAPVGSTSRVERLKIGSDGVININNLAGTGTAYACVDASGNLFRSLTPCR